jgi:hypothetical protein
VRTEQLSRRIFGFVLLLAALPCAGLAGVLAEVTVEAGAHLRVDTPVFISLGGVAGYSQDATLRLEEIRKSQHLFVPCQVEPGSPARLWWTLTGTTPAGGTRTYRLSQVRPADDPASDAATSMSGAG